jgi:hypothetical protein
LRYHEAGFYRAAFAAASGPPQDSYFMMIANLDAFLWALGSVSELCTPEEKRRLIAADIFRFLLAARHATTHQGVLPAPVTDRIPVRPFNRVLDLGGDEEACELLLDVERFEQLLDAAAVNHPPGKKSYEDAKPYLARLRSAGDLRPPLAATLDEGLAIAKSALCL